MRNLSLTEKRCYASALMTAILLLYVALASVSPLQLSADISQNGVGSYIRAMDITNGNALSSNIENRSRHRSQLLLAMNSAAQQITASPVGIPSGDPSFNSYRVWNRDIGCELEAMPHSDMVALK